MLVFNSFISLVLCVKDQTQESLEGWRRVLGALFDGYTFTTGGGGWPDGDHVVEEPNIIFTVWGPDLKAIGNLWREGKRLQEVEEQEAISLIFNHPSVGWEARILFDEDDWAETLKDLVLIFGGDEDVEVEVE